MIRINAPSLGAEEKAVMLGVLERGYLSQGSETAHLEVELAALVGTRHAVATSSGTAALHLALLAHGIGPGDEVITTSFTMVATVNSVLYVGARPVFADVDPMTCNLDPRSVEPLITSRTRAILPVHLYGCPCDMEAIVAIGYRTQTRPHHPDIVVEEIDRYDPDDARAVSNRVRAVAGLDSAVEAIERIYRQALAEYTPMSWEEELRAAGEYLHWLNPFLREREQALGWAERLLEIAEERNQRIEELTAESNRQRSWGEGLLPTAEERGRLIEELNAEVGRRSAWAEGLLARLWISETALPAASTAQQ